MSTVHAAFECLSGTYGQCQLLVSLAPSSPVCPGQADTDTYVEDEVKKDLVQFMRGKGLYLTNRMSKFNEVKDFHTGLPELAQFWLVRLLQRREP